MKDVVTVIEVKLSCGCRVMLSEDVVRSTTNDEAQIEIADLPQIIEAHERMADSVHPRTFWITDVVSKEITMQ